MRLTDPSDGASEPALTPAEDEAAAAVAALAGVSSQLEEALACLDEVPALMLQAARARMQVDNDKDAVTEMCSACADHVAAVRDRAALLAPRACTVLARIDVTHAILSASEPAD